MRSKQAGNKKREDEHEREGGAGHQTSSEESNPSPLLLALLTCSHSASAVPSPLLPATRSITLPMEASSALVREAHSACRGERGYRG
jgi:hypothetical protein